MKNKRVVKKTVQKNCITTTATVEVKILQLIKMGEYYPSDLKESTGMSKQTLNYHLNKLKDSGYITNYSRGIYDITDSGKKILATYENNENKRYIQLENMRYKAEIYKGFEKIMERIRNPKKTKLNSGVIQYDGKIGDISVRVFHSHMGASIEFCCPKWLGENMYEIMYDAKKQMDGIVGSFCTIEGVQIGVLQQSMKPEWAIPNPIAETLLKSTDSSQIRTPNGVINRSAGRNADWETDDIVKAIEVLNIPNDIKEIKNMLKNPIITTTNSKDYPMYG
jgi:DNA-binding MarR family transcriptional regulator